MRQYCLPKVVWQLKRVKPSATCSEYQTEALNKVHVSRHSLPMRSDQQGNGNSLLWLICHHITRPTHRAVWLQDKTAFSYCHPCSMSSALCFFESFFALCACIAKLLYILTMSRRQKYISILFLCRASCNHNVRDRVSQLLPELLKRRFQLLLPHATLLSPT